MFNQASKGFELWKKALQPFHTNLKNLRNAIFPTEGVYSVGAETTAAFGPFAAKIGGGLFVDFENNKFGAFTKSGANGIHQPGGGLELSVGVSLDRSPSISQFEGLAVEGGNTFGPIGIDYGLNNQGLTSAGIDLGLGLGVSVVQTRTKVIN